MATKRPWMPLYVADYLGDTAHLNTAEHGAYLLLIMHYWTKGRLPLSEESIQRITRMTNRQWKKSRDVLKSFFVADWRHHRVEKEIAQAIEKSRVNSANATKSHVHRKRFVAASVPELPPTLHTSDSTLQTTGRVVQLDPEGPDEVQRSALANEQDKGSLIDPTYRPNNKLVEQCHADGATDAIILEQRKLFVAYNEQRGTRSKNWDATWTIWWARWKEREKPEKVFYSEVSAAAPWKPSEADWVRALELYKRSGSIWPRWGGNSPGSRSCLCPPDILRKHCIDPETGFTMRPSGARGQNVCVEPGYVREGGEAIVCAVDRGDHGLT
jgi:uncharacterized protein YdaU (DUF1376 family)